MVNRAQETMDMLENKRRLAVSEPKVDFDVLLRALDDLMVSGKIDPKLALLSLNDLAAHAKSRIIEPNTISAAQAVDIRQMRSSMRQRGR